MAQTQTIITSIFSTDLPSPMARSWSRHHWNHWEDNSYSQWQSHSQAPPSISPSFAPDIPTHWKETAVHHDETCLHGYPLFKTSKPFNRRLGLENEAFMVWIPCKHRWQHCAGTIPITTIFSRSISGSCSHTHSRRVSSLQSIFEGCARTSR